LRASQFSDAETLRETLRETLQETLYERSHMSGSGPAELADEVSEAAATGEVKAIFADIRKAMQMPFVNLIWRRLAVSTAALSWTWDTMKPLYSGGAIYEEAARLRDAQILPTVPRLPPSALRAVGVDGPAEMSIRAILAGYDRGNPLNLIAFSTVLERLRDEKEAGMQQGDDAETRPVETQNDTSRAALPPAPRILSFADMDETTATLARAASLIGAPEAGPHVWVSLPRHLAYWPGFLSLYFTALKPLHDDGRLFSAVDAVLADGRNRGRRLVSKLGDNGLPPETVRTSVRKPIETLVPHAMGRMIPVVSLLQRMLSE